MRGFWQGIGTALAALAVAALAAALLLPMFGRSSPASGNTRNLSNAKQLALGVKLYAMDNEGRLPMHLSELIPDYIDAAGWEHLLFDTRKDNKDSDYPKQDWLYFGAFLDETNAPPVLIASPQPATDSSKRWRIVIHNDWTGTLITEPEYQAELRKTVAHLHARAAAAARSNMPEKSLAP